MRTSNKLWVQAKFSCSWTVFTTNKLQEHDPPLIYLELTSVYINIFTENHFKQLIKSIFLTYWITYDLYNILYFHITSLTLNSKIFCNVCTSRRKYAQLNRLIDNILTWYFLLSHGQFTSNDQFPNITDFPWWLLPVILLISGPCKSVRHLQWLVL